MKNILMTSVFAAGLMSVPAFASSTDASGPAYDAILKGQWAEAESMLRQGLAQNPQDASRLLNLAFVLQNTGRQAEATGVYEKVLQLNSNPVVAVADPYTIAVHPTRAKHIARKGMATLESAKR